MVFSSFPVYLDHPNLHQFPQQPDHQQQGISSVVDHNGQVHHPPQPQLPPMAVGGGGGSIRPGSMVDRARLAKLPLPEAGLKCPRCDSSNTKFCYFNNYSLTQPRHFCKTCRRYWTRGGALRNVPVGGGCRRNKKTKSSSSGSKSSMAAADQQRQVGMGSNNNNNNMNSGSPSRCSPDVSGHFTTQSLPFMAAFQSLNHYGGGHIGQTIGGFQPQMSSGSLPNLGFNNNFGGIFEPQTSLFPLINPQGHQEVEPSSNSMLASMAATTTSAGMDGNNPSVKREENLTKQFLAANSDHQGNNNNNNNNNQFWGGGGSSWTGFSGLNSSSTTHLL